MASIDFTFSGKGPDFRKFRGRFKKLFEETETRVVIAETTGVIKKDMPDNRPTSSGKGEDYIDARKQGTRDAQISTSPTSITARKTFPSRQSTEAIKFGKKMSIDVIKTLDKRFNEALRRYK